MGFPMKNTTASSQWERLLLHLGDWRGSFTQMDASLRVLSDRPSQVVLEGREHNRVIRQTVRFFPGATPGSIPSAASAVAAMASAESGEAVAPSVVLEYRSLNRGMLLCETGAFSQGSLQFSPLGDFGAEFGFIAGVPSDAGIDPRRLRLVLQFRSTAMGHTLSELTLMRETQAGTVADESPPLSVESLLGTWEGTATSIEPDWYEPPAISTHLHLAHQGDGLQQTLSSPGFSKQSTGRITATGIEFEGVQVILLPGGASCTVPTLIPRQKPFFIELGWLLAPNLRHRLMRTYDAQGSWTGLTLIQEQRMAR